MEILNDIADLERLSGPLHLAIGVFDGVHLGHQAVINAAKESAASTGGTSVVVTFDPHPVQVLSPQNAPRLLTASAHKLSILDRVLKIDSALFISFSRKFSEQTGEEFIRDLIGHSHDGISRICVGEQWQFGKGRSGDIALLKKLGEELSFSVTGVRTIEAKGMRVSSTRIREAVGAGDFSVARALMGRSYAVLGTVIEGQKLGRTIGFPTANFTVYHEQLPPTGVYAVRARGAGDSWDGVANLGYRPTVKGGEIKRLLEVHLFDLDYEIYGEEMEVEFVQYIRPEQKFDGVDALKEQIGRDVKVAKQVL